MKLAALYDIHGNLPALEAALREVRDLGVEEIVVGGDVLPGPMPAETMDLLLGLDIPTRFIHGNCELEILTLLEGGKTRVGESFLPGFRWVAEQLRPDHFEAIRSWPATLTVRMSDSGDKGQSPIRDPQSEILFCHATPRDVNEIFTKETAEEKLLPIFSPSSCRDDRAQEEEGGRGMEVPGVVVCGHTHMQFDRQVGGVRVINAGSMGMPFGAPGAYWLLLDPSPRLMRTDYDLESAAARVRASGHPDADDIAARNILNPASEEEMVKLYTNYELRS